MGVLLDNSTRALSFACGVVLVAARQGGRRLLAVDVAPLLIVSAITWWPQLGATYIRVQAVGE